MRCLLANEEQSSVKKRMQQQRIQRHLQQVSQVTKLVSSGLFTKDTLSALMQGDLNALAINFSLLTGSILLGEVSNSLLTQGEILSADEALILEKNLSLNGKLALSILTDEEVLSAGKRRFLGYTMKAAAPFVGQAATDVFFIFNLKNQIKEYKAGNKDALPGIITNGVIIGVDGLESGIEAAEYLEVIEGVSEFTGPIGEGINALVWLGSDIAHVKAQMASIEKYVHLNEEEKIIQDIRAFFHFSPSTYLETKAANNQRVQSGIVFLKKHTDIKRTIFSSGGLSSQVFLDKKVKLIVDESMPDAPSEGSLYCLYGRSKTYISPDQWIPILPYPPFMNLGDEIATYFCNNALGVEYLLNRTQSYTLIALGAGNHSVKGSMDALNILLVSDGMINATGGDAGNLILLQGNAILGTLKGGKGANNKIKLENFKQNTQEFVLVDKQRFICGKNDSDISIVNECGIGNGLKIENIEQLDGRKNKQDLIYITEKLEYIDGYGGENNDYPDHIYITDESNKNPKIILRNNTVVHAFGSSEHLESVNYRIPSDESGVTHVQLRFTESTSQRFYFDFSLDDLKAISMQDNNVTFNFLSQNKTLNVIILDPYKNLSVFQNNKMHYPECPSNAYYIFQANAEVKLLNRNTIYAQQHSNKTVDEIVGHYPEIASRLNMAFVMQLQHNETVLIGHDKHQILYNNPWGKSHLLGNGAENVYVITAANNADKFPVPEVTIYYVQKDLTDTLDFRKLVQQAKQVCLEQEITPSVSQQEQDLVIKLNAHYYPMANSCVKLMTTWPIASVRLKDSLLDNSYQNLDVVLQHTTMNIIANQQRWDFVYLPLVFNKDKQIISLTNTDIEQDAAIVVLKKLGQYRFMRNNDTDLLLSNALESNTTQRDLCTIIYSQFYQLPAMREKVLSTTLTFLDQQIMLKNYEPQINNASSFATISQQYTAEIYNEGALNQTNLSNRGRSKRQVNHQATIKTDDRIVAMADQYLDKYDHLNKTNNSHKKTKKNRKFTYAFSEVKVKNVEITEKKTIHPHSSNKQIDQGKTKVKLTQAYCSQNSMQNNRSRTAEISYSTVSLSTAKPSTKKSVNFYRTVKHASAKQPMPKSLVSKADPISPKLITQKKDNPHHQQRNQRWSFSPVTVAPKVRVLFVLGTFTHPQTAMNHAEIQTQLEINNSKNLRLPQYTLNRN